MSLANDYSALDRLLHRIALAKPAVQKTLADMENDWFKKTIAKVNSQHEVFVTGLPRSGTTLVLELLYGTNEFETFTYRHMPFILTPLMWQRFSKPFQQKAATKERAHGDAMTVSFDSPEAFEEVIWLSHLKDSIVKQNTLNVLSDHSIDEDCRQAIRGTVNKLLASSDESNKRYLSKNNANISRLNVLNQLFPSATIIVPFRHPAAHIASLMTQHERFLDMHQQDKFAQDYMKWLGHYDFGSNFKPINFNGWCDDREIAEKPDANFWLRYWHAAYTAVLAQKNTAICLVDYDKLLQSSEQVLTALADKVKLEQPERLIESASKLRSPTSKPINTEHFDSSLWQQAQALHEKLQTMAL